MQTSWVAGLAEGLYFLKADDFQSASVAARGEMTGFLAARYAATLVVPKAEKKKALRMMPILKPRL